MEKLYINLKKKEDKQGEIEFEAEIPVEVLERYELEALTSAAADFSLPGFRKGKVPEHLVREHLGQMELWEDAANEALRDAMQEIAADERLDVLGRPQLVITKIAPKNPLSFKIRYALSPEVSLPDYKKIGRGIMERKDSTEPTEAEIDGAITRIQTMIAPQGNKDEKNTAIPPLTDDFVKQLGPFNTVDDFRKEVKRQLGQEKTSSIKDGKRDEVIKEIVAHSKVAIPSLLIEQEFAELIHDRDEQLRELKLSLEEYLKQIGKTEATLEKDQRALIEENIKTSLVIQEIRKKENLTADERDIHTNIAQLKLRYPEQSEAALHRTAEALIVQEKLFALFETLEEKK